MNLNDLNKLIDQQSNTDRMPALFVGHGTPMNAIESNEFTDSWKNIGEKLPTPKAIICISAHWETNGSYVTAMERPKTIHDFGGFPADLYRVEYPAEGNPILADEVQQEITYTSIGLDHSWGLDHGTWSVVKHIYPEANIPIIQLSIDYSKGAEYHYNLAKQLAYFRDKGVLIIGSGNIIHNLRMARAVNGDFNTEIAYDWALEMREEVNKKIVDGDHKSLIDYQHLNKHWQLAIPTTDHYNPLLYILGLQQKNEEVILFNDKVVGGSLSMTSVIIS